MSTKRRPVPRPTTRVPGNVGAPAKTPTGRVPQQKPTTSRGVRAGSDHAATARSAPAPKKGNPALLWGGVGGGALLLIIIIAVAASGGSKKHPEASNTRKAAVKPVDVAGLERDGEEKCESGLAIIQKCEGLMSGRVLNASEKTQLKGDLDRGIALIKEGMSRFDEANQKSQHTYNTTKYTNAMKAARMKVGELK